MLPTIIHLLPLPGSLFLYGIARLRYNTSALKALLQMIVIQTLWVYVLTSRSPIKEVVLEGSDLH